MRIQGAEDGLVEQGLSAMLQRDAFLAFRALCKLSTRTSETASGAADPAALRGKVLSS